MPERLLKYGGPTQALARASRALAGALDNRQALAALRDVTVPALADRCEVWLEGEALPEGVPAGAARLDLPLVAHGRRLGLLTLERDTGGAFSDGEAAVAEAVAAQAAVAIDRGRLYAETREVARTLQRSFLPAELPRLDGVEIGVRYRPAGRVNAAGGDFYDVFRNDDGSIGFVIGDVVGKGAAAAAVTAIVRHTIYAGFLRDGDPVAATGLANEALLRRTSAGQFCTAAVGALRTAGGGGLAVELVCAGHPPPLVVRADRVEAVGARSPLLGVLPGPRFTPTTLELTPGDALVLYTDGAFELPPRRGDERDLMPLLASAHGESAVEIAERVEHQALVRTGGELRDDVAVVVVRAAT